MLIDCKYKLGSVVFLLTDPDQDMRVVIAIIVRSGNYILYGLSHLGNETWHVETEITTQKVWTNNV